MAVFGPDDIFGLAGSDPRKCFIARKSRVVIDFARVRVTMKTNQNELRGGSVRRIARLAKHRS
ncbi:hypothetical protein PILCRDRAFT_810768 [Piloderma croceum F 1598]|uniref:Uncharacterized protein n=1 Tax=Piloderma croceum (strain F 1598) TaxID=765440 RepID=A0A0C3CP31_PILCF|nr:hypothetical protein PILCRDRAFT_810768 [Piloderma croceum F 1598]